MNERIIGIMGAMPEEIIGLLQLLEETKDFVYGMRTYYTGKINGIKVIIVFSRWGKVAAAATVSTLIQQFGITELLFTGVAGGINPALNIGDIVVATRLVQHDMDARPLMQQYEIPLLKKTYFETDTTLLNKSLQAVQKMIESNRLHQLINTTDLNTFKITTPKVHTGDIASGDQFFAGTAQKQHLLQQLPDVLCVEMEGAAVAQVCFEYNIPYIIIRTISDIADEHSPIDFPAFILTISSRYSVEIIKHLVS